MGHDTFESKRNFVTGSLRRCLSDAIPGLADLEYRLEDNCDTGGLQETIIIRFVDGYVQRMCVTGQSLVDIAIHVPQQILESEVQ